MLRKSPTFQNLKGQRKKNKKYIAKDFKQYSYEKQITLLICKYVCYN